MSDNHRRYRSIKQALRQMYPQELQGHAARKLNTLAALISGIVGSQRTNYAKIASKVPETAKLESRVKRYARWVNEAKDTEATPAVEVLPFATELLAALSPRTLVLVMDGSEVGRGCLALLVSVIYRGRALPLAWLVIQGTKGHFPAEQHIQLLEAVQARLPTGADVVFLGAGEFDSVELQTALQGFPWTYVCRTSVNTILVEAGEAFSCQELLLGPGDVLSLPQVRFTRQGFGPVHVIAWWRKGYQTPLFLVTNLELWEEACHWYQKRFRIETFFSDQKSRGFHLHKSHLARPERLARLMIAACLAYIWVVYLGDHVKKTGQVGLIHRTDRCDLSLFQLGLRWLDYLLDHALEIPVAFTLLVESFVR